MPTHDTGSGFTLGQLLDTVGPSLLELVAGRVDPLSAVTGVVFHDPLDASAPVAEAIVLGVGVVGASAVDELLLDAASGSATAIVLRNAAGGTRRLLRDVARAGLVVFELGPGIPWGQVVDALGSAMAGPGRPWGDHGSGDPDVDLFALANSVARLVGAPVTIEDLGSRVLAFSDGQERADEARKTVVLARQVSQHDTEFLRREGFFRAIYGQDEVVVIPTGPVGGTMLRAVVRVQLHGEVLGSIWAAVEGEFGPPRRQALLESARMVAPHVARIAHTQRGAAQAAATRVATLLAGGPRAREVAFTAGLARRPLEVVAISTRPVEAQSGSLREAGTALAAHLSGASGALSAYLEGRLYVVNPSGEEQPDREVASAVGSFVARWSADELVAAVGGPVHDAAHLQTARTAADAALRVLLTRSVTGGLEGSARVVRASDLQGEVLLQRLADVVATENLQPQGGLARLLAHDDATGNELVVSLRAWLDHSGDVRAAATAVHVHPNTFRYRLQRIASVAEVDLGDPEVRFALLLQLRLFR